MNMCVLLTAPAHLRTYMYACMRMRAPVHACLLLNEQKNRSFL